MITLYIDKISSLVLDDIFKQEGLRYFNIYIPCLSVHRLSMLTILSTLQMKFHDLQVQPPYDSDNCSVSCIHHEDIIYLITLRVCLSF